MSSKKKEKGGGFASRKRGRGGGRTREVVFDPEARREYLRGFSERKKERRAYGLAMQKVKDRKARLENRKVNRDAEMERIHEAERQKEAIEQSAWEENHAASSDDEEEPSDQEGGQKKPKNGVDRNANNSKSESTSVTTTMYQDQETQAQWGGNVVVTTSAAFPGSDEDEPKPQAKKRRKGNNHRSVDSEQQFAGNVEKYLHQVKGNLPGKKKHAHHKVKGKHGASAMNGVGGTANFKTAQKFLAKSLSKSSKKMDKGKGRRSHKR